MSLKLDRSFAQKVRLDRNLDVNYETKAKRAQFWAKAQRDQARYNEEVVNQSLEQISQGTFKQDSQFAVANIHAATLSSAPPSLPGETTIAGIDSGGAAPPPPPVL